MWGLKQQNNIAWNPQPLRLMKPTIIQLNNQQVIFELLSYQIKKHLKAIGIQV
jgi:hypothetical protein